MLTLAIRDEFGQLLDKQGKVMTPTEKVTHWILSLLNSPTKYSALRLYAWPTNGIRTCLYAEHAFKHS